MGFMTDPKIEVRNEQPYVGIRSQAEMTTLDRVIPEGLGAVFGWLGARGVDPAGPPFIRYYVIDMERQLEVEVGVPVAKALEGEGQIRSGSLPAGRYAALVYTGIDHGIEANGALLEWGAAQGLKWDMWDAGDGFGSRVEFFLTNPDDEPDRDKWETEVAIKLADS